MKECAIIVDPFSSGALYAQELIKRDIFPIAVLSQFPIYEQFASSFRQDDFDKIFILRNDTNTLINEIKNYVVDKKIILCLAGSEPGVLLADILANEFCPLKSNDINLTQARRNKFLMAERLDQLQIKTPLTTQVSSSDEAVSWAKENGFLPAGVVVKPINSAGTDGVKVCFNDEDIKVAIKDILGKKNKLNIMNNEVIVQEFLSGEEYVVDSVSYKKNHIITNICKYKKTSANGSSFVYDYLDFLSAHGTEQSELVNYCFAVLDGLGIENGPAHSEIMLTSKGPRLIETGARLHGGIAIHATRLATGNSQLDITLDYLLKGQLSISDKSIGYNIKNHVRIVFLISRESGRVEKVTTNLEAIKHLSSFVFMNTQLQQGAIVTKTIDLFTSTGLLLLSHANAEQVEQDYQHIRELEQKSFAVINEELTCQV